ncbi:transmembrane protein 238 [Denticeps clupeoides]|uniref:transmembrane protein 238 n=1 Tax=Denticeps clupeoides TaxID=299321 RepID=UPI0010A2FB91|nr:transmembrane protein 238-like [Denticeps clupeoides]XP_028843722.1 transmembrane protein 238-like [Denticeps clupeoides]
MANRRLLHPRPAPPLLCAPQAQVAQVLTCVGLHLRPARRPARGFSLGVFSTTVLHRYKVSRACAMEPAFRGLGRCSCAFWLAVAFDLLGLVILLLGVFLDIFFYDFLIYAGAIIIFLSLIWWVFWYTGNIEVPPADLEDDVGLLKKKNRGVAGVVRRLSSRLSSGIRSSVRRDGGPRGRAGPGRTGPRVPVTIPMARHENVNTVSAAVQGGSETPAI